MRQDFARLFKRDSVPPSGFGRLPTILADGIVATSHPVATQAGVRAFDAGGNAVDAALAAAAALTVAEPCLNGIGGDAFAIVWRDGELYGLNGSGRSPEVLDEPRVDRYGPRSVTVPGAVAAWAELAERFGRLGLDRAVGPAAELAEHGLAATARVGTIWRRAEELGRAPFPAPAIASRYRLPELGGTLRRIADEGPSALYEGEVAAAIASVTWLSENDLAAHRSEWVEPLRLRYRDVEVCELPPNTQGVAALIALGIGEGLEGEDELTRLHAQIEAIKLGLAEAYAHVGDGPLPDGLLAPERLAELRGRVDLARAAAVAPAGAEYGDTTYLCAADGELAISLIQSNYEGFGSGLAAPGTGIPLQNRGAGFVETEGHPNQLRPGRRPFHTIIPGMLIDERGAPGPFGVMGGPMQAQGHLQVVASIVDGALDPQAALDRARFRVERDGLVALEPGLWGLAGELERLGHAVVREEVQHEFGVGQAILTLEESLIAGSDGRGDGHAAGI